jgi:hypothetical protein
MWYKLSYYKSYNIPIITNTTMAAIPIPNAVIQQSNLVLILPKSKIPLKVNTVSGYASKLAI